MSLRFDEMVLEIERRLASEAQLVDVALENGVAAFVSSDHRLAGHVVEGDELVNHAEVVIERLCLDAMGLQQPVARDLRFVTGVMKTNSDLERMGDLACSIAKHTWRLGKPPESAFASAVHEMADRVRSMSRDAVRALIDRNAELARRVWQMDSEVDEMYRRLVAQALDAMKDGRRSAEDATVSVAVARNLERIGDHATNIAEDVVFVVEGTIVRHNAEARIAPEPPDGI